MNGRLCGWIKWSERSRHLVFLLLVAAGGVSLKAQQLPTFFHYSNNWSVLNPAALSPDLILDDGYRMSVQSTVRRQWADVEDAPRTQTLATTFLPETQSIILGGHLMNDQTGAIGWTGLYGRFAYRLRLTRHQTLSVGVHLGLAQYRVRAAEIRLLEPDDILGNTNQNQLLPDAGLGVFYQFRNRLYGGISFPQVFNWTTRYRNDRGDQYQLTRLRHAYAMGGANLFLNNDNRLSITAWVKRAPGVPWTADVNLRYFYQDVFWLGMGGGTTDVAHLEAGLLIGNGLGYLNGRLALSFGYDFTLSSRQQLLGSTLEIGLRYTFLE